MSATAQVLYPAGDGSKFDYDYYTTKHAEVLESHLGKYLESSTASRGLPDTPDGEPAYHTIATLRFKDMATLQAALGAAGPVLADIPNFTDSKPQVVTGEVIM